MLAATGLPVLPDALALSLPTWLVMHEDLRRSQRHRAMFDFLAEAMARIDPPPPLALVDLGLPAVRSA